MKKMFSIGYSNWAFNLAMLVLRVGSAVLMMSHGYSKLVQFEQTSARFMNFMGLGPTVSLSLVIFAEFFCSIFIILGLFTRLAAVPLVIDMIIAVVQAHNMEVFGNGEKPALFFLTFLTVLLLGPGRVSIDGMINK